MARRSPLEVAKERAAIETARLEATIAKHKRTQLTRAYEAASSDNYHPRRKEVRSADAVMGASTDKLRAIARYLDENHDLAIAVFNDLVDKTIGTGVGIEPMVRDGRGELLPKVNDAIRAAQREWFEAMPEATRSMPWNECVRLAFRTWVRDGEVLVHHVEGNRPGTSHRGGVPYSIELLEPDYLPFHVHRDARNRNGQNRIVHGIEKNGWREAVAYYLYTDHPGDVFAGVSLQSMDLVRIPAHELTHLKLVKRLGQTRGVTVLHGVLTRMEDLKEYDDSERIAARVASAFTAAITRSADYAGPQIETVAGASRRVMEMSPGMIFQDLLPGESVATIASDRPSAQYEPWRAANERSIAGGTGTSRSSISRRYDGSYSSQRQELVESEVLYGRLRDYFTALFHRDIHRRFVELAVLSGRVAVPPAVDMATLTDCAIVPPPTSWIDPMKEVQADILAIENNLMSRHQAIRARGRDPHEVDKQIAADPNHPAAQSAPSKATPKLNAPQEVAA